MFVVVCCSTSAPAELGGEIRNVSRSVARTQVLLQARKLHVYGSGSFGAFWRVAAAGGTLRVPAAGEGSRALRPKGIYPYRYNTSPDDSMKSL